MELVEGGWKVNLRRVISNGGDPANVQQKKSTICSPKMITQDMWSENPGLTLLSSTSTGIKAVIMGFRLVRITVWIIFIEYAEWLVAFAIWMRPEGNMTVVELVSLLHENCHQGVLTLPHRSCLPGGIQVSSKLSSRRSTSEFGLLGLERECGECSDHRPIIAKQSLCCCGTQHFFNTGLLSLPQPSPPALPGWSPEAQVLLSLGLCLPPLLHSYCLLEGDSSKKATRKSKKLLKVAHMA